MYVRLPVLVHRHARTGPDGLTEEDVAARRADYGPNTITDAERVTLLQRIWGQVNNALIWILIASAIVSAGLRCAQSWDGVEATRAPSLCVCVAPRTAVDAARYWTQPDMVLSQ
jgi:magnesium-transporting ATPase (P-type)